MSLIILQPAASKSSQDHYKRTISNPVSIERIEPYVSQQLYSEIRKQYPEGKVPVWGVMNGKNDTIKKKWEKISRGDITLFSGKGGIFASAVTTLKFQNRALAEQLWGTDEAKNTWENIYLVKEVKNIHIPYEKFNAILGYNEKFVIQGFHVLDEEKSTKLNMQYGLFCEDICEPVSEADYSHVVERLEGNASLDFESMTCRRREQSFLRYYLFDGCSDFVCGICGKRLPVNMMVTAHIKERNCCSKKEKLDFRHVIMPMCKFGCDDLYEKGYIYVQDGLVKINRQKWVTPDMEAELSKLENKKCPYYNPKTKLYFEYHMKKFNIQ